MAKKIVSIALVLLVVLGCASNAFADSWAAYAKQFNDLQPKQWDWALDAIGWASYYEITNGTTKTTFSPGQGCTRGQIVTFIYRQFGEPTSFTHKMPFKDVSKSAYYYNAIMWAYQMGIVDGIDSTHFAPNNACNRAQIVTMLYRAYKQSHNSAPGKPNPFIDVEENTWYSAAVNWAYSNGIAKGVGAATPGGDVFMPGLTCNRAQAMTFLFRACSA